MTGVDVERLVQAALQEEAGEVMQDLNSNTALQELTEAVGRDDRRRPRLWGGLAAAAAAVVAVGATLWPQSTPDPAPAPLTPPRTLTPAEQVATDFVAAAASYDRARMASYVAPGARLTYGHLIGPQGWKLANRYTEATRLLLYPDECYELFTSTRGTRVGCPFSFDWLGSDALGTGPFDNNLYQVTVKDGQVVEFTESIASNDSFDPFWQWLDSTHPDDRATLESWSDPEATGVAVSDALQLWQRRTNEFVAYAESGRRG